MAKIITIPNNIVPYLINLDINGDTTDERVWSQQYDTKTRYILAAIWNNGIAYPLSTSHTIHFACTKPQTGFGILNEAGIDTQGRIVYEITDQTTAENGRFKAEFRIYDPSTGKVGTPNFNVYVEKSALSNDTIISTPEVNILTELIIDATEAIADMGGLISTANTAITNANNAATNANSKATLANTATTNANTATSLANTASTNANTKATLADQKATLANDAAILATTATTNANTAISNMNSLNTTVTGNETTRQSQETTRQNYYNAYRALETYNNTKAYIVGNKVTYLGGHYENILASTGVPPTYNTDNTNWKCIGAKGQDGTGVGDMLANQYDVNNKKTDIFDYADTKATYKDKLSNATGSFITCPVADDALAHIKKMEGETKQVVTVKNKNLAWKPTHASTTQYSRTVYALADLLPSTEYTISIIILTGEQHYVNEVLFTTQPVIIGDGTRKSVTVTTKSVISKSDIGQYDTSRGWIIFKNMKAEVSSGNTKDLQIELGSTMTSYEVATQNSPSPEYPSPLLYVKNFDVLTTNKNLLNGIFEQGHINASGGLYNDPMAIRTKDFIPVTSGLTYTKSNSLNRPSGRIAFYNNGVFVSAIVDVATFTVPSGVNQVKYSIYNTGNIVPSDVTWAQLELGSVATPYEQYKSDKINISSFPFMGLPSGVKNTIEVVNGILTKVQRVKELVFNGAESWIINSPWDTSAPSIIHASVTIPDWKIGQINWMVSHMNKKYSTDGGSHITEECTYANIINQGFYIFFSGSRLSGWSETLTASEKVVLFKDWLASNPFTIQYELATPIYTPIADIYLKSWKGITHLFTNSDPQVTLTADFKSELWSRDYLQDVALKSKFDATSEIEFVEAASDIDIATKDTLPTLFGKILKSIKTLRSALAAKINVSDIINNDTTGGTGKVASAETVKILGQEVDTLNNNLVNSTRKIYDGTIESNVKNTILENWSKMPYGASMCALYQGNQCFAFVGKTSEVWGSVHIIGYGLEVPLFGKLVGGSWYWNV